MRAPGRRSLGARLRRRAGHALAASVAVGLAVSGSCATAPRSRPAGPRLPEVRAAAGGPHSLPGGGAPPAVRVGLLVGVSRASLSADSGVVVRAVAGADQPSEFL